MSSIFPSDTACMEHVGNIKVRNVSSKIPVHEETFLSVIKPGNLTVLSDSVKFELHEKTTLNTLPLKNKRFENCDFDNSVSLRLLCKNPQNDTEELDLTIEGLDIPKTDISGLNCWAKGFLGSLKAKDQRPSSPCFTEAGLGCENDGTTELLIGVSTGGSLLFLSCAAVVSGLLLYKRRDHVEYTVKTDVTPPHIIIRKTDFVKEDLDSAAVLQVLYFYFYLSKINSLHHLIKMIFCSLANLIRTNIYQNLRRLRHLMRVTSSPSRPAMWPGTTSTSGATGTGTWSPTTTTSSTSSLRLATHHQDTSMHLG